MKNSQKKLNIRERVFKWIFRAGDVYRLFSDWLTGLCRFCFSVSLILFLIGSIFYIGFASSSADIEGMKSAFRILFLLLFFSKYLPELLNPRRSFTFSTAVKIAVFIYSFAVFRSNFLHSGDESAISGFFYGNSQIIISVVLMGISGISGLFPGLRSVKVPPALIFTFSYVLMILIGSGLLMLPNAHDGSLRYLDSLFTSVSAVCVTGLVSVDTATTYTELGRIILLCLIQAGGLGIMTFTGFFSYIFTSRSSFSDRLLMKELFSAESMNNLFKILAKILTFTFLIELAGAFLLYSSLDTGFSNRFFFSVFHSVSAFCNAGFSTLNGNLHAEEIRNNSMLQLSVALLIIMGGLGFPVLMNLYSNVKYRLLFIWTKLSGKRVPVKPVHRNVATRIVLFMTTILIIAGALLYYLLEIYLKPGTTDLSQKIIISFFGSVSSRTAGFNITDITLWGYPTVFLMISLMWIGASPGSTGGGIKTTTFAIAARSAWNNIRGSEHLKIGNREVGPATIRRVLSIIFLSLLVIGIGFFVLLLSEPGKDPSYLLFECVSAYSTVGLSMVNSSLLSETGKIVDIVLMFIGRVGPLTLFIGLFQTYRKSYSTCPEIDIVIN